jgi:pyruvate/2-oxoglutarate dehydrogenase complex dihydrolipoamide dehydrogenase (E3) component
LAREVRRDYDLLVIGTGGSGMGAALRGAELGYRVAIVEAGTIGGTCVNRGCVPSQTLMRAAAVYHHAGHHAFQVNMGLHAGSAFVGVTRFIGRSGERWTYTASGPVANVAARLCALAQDGAILLSNTAANCLTEAYVLQRLGEYHFKNIKYPVGVYQLLRESVTNVPIRHV